jgi:hypothetical protein
VARERRAAAEEIEAAFHGAFATTEEITLNHRYDRSDDECRLLSGLRSGAGHEGGLHCRVAAGAVNPQADRFFLALSPKFPRFLALSPKFDLTRGDLIESGYNSNYGRRKKAAYVYLTATLDAATWGAELAVGEGPGRIYMVEPTGPIEDDPNLTDKKYPGNPTKSYRARDPLRVTARS